MKICYTSIISSSEFKNMFILLHWVSRGCRNTVFVWKLLQKAGFFVTCIFTQFVQTQFLEFFLSIIATFIDFDWLFVIHILFFRNEKCLYCVSRFFEIAQWTIEKKFANVWIANGIVFSFSFCKKSASHPLPARLPGGSSFVVFLM